MPRARAEYAPRLLPRSTAIAWKYPGRFHIGKRWFSYRYARPSAVNARSAQNGVAHRESAFAPFSLWKRACSAASCRVSASSAERHSARGSSPAATAACSRRRSVPAVAKPASSWAASTFSATKRHLQQPAPRAEHRAHSSAVAHAGFAGSRPCSHFDSTARPMSQLGFVAAVNPASRE